MKLDKSDRKELQRMARKAYSDSLMAVKGHNAKYANIGLGGLSALSVIVMHAESTRVSESMELSDLRIEVHGLMASLYDDIEKAGLE
jgi:hypothetical protein